MAAILPAPLKIDDLVAYCKKPLRKSLRVNRLKISIEDFLTLAKNEHWQLSPIPWCADGFWIDGIDQEEKLGNHVAHLAGLFYIQEASSMLPPVALYGDKPHRLAQDSLPSFPLVLDMASAPGSKTTQLASYMQRQGLLVANELSSSRLKVLHANLVRCGVKNAAITHFNGDVFGSWLPERFDAILLDAPCSGEGAVRKDSEAMKNWSQNAIDEMASVQRALIDSAFSALKPNGTLVYSTCTLSREENQDVCHYLKARYPEAVSFVSLGDLFDGAERSLTPEGFLHVFPQTYDSEGFFIAKIHKTASTASPSDKTHKGVFPFKPADKKQQSLVESHLSQWAKPSAYQTQQLWVRDKEYWLFPNEFSPFIGQFKFSRIGQKLAEQHAKGFKWDHQFVTSLSAKDLCGSVVELSENQTRDWFKGLDLPLTEAQQAQSLRADIILTYANSPIGLAKLVKNKFKNNLPRDLVKSGL